MVSFVIFGSMIVCFVSGGISSFYMNKVNRIMNSNNCPSSWLDFMWSYEKFKIFINDCSNEYDKKTYANIYKKALFWRKFSLICGILFLIGFYITIALLHG